MSDTISRKGVFIPDITVEMFRNASLESIEDLMASGEMEDILLPSAQPDDEEANYWHEKANSYERTLAKLSQNIAEQPQRMRGEWIEDGYNHYKAVCSECGEPCATYVMGKPRDNFCKWCGADMRGDGDET